MNIRAVFTFWLLWIMNAAMNTSVQVSVWIYIFNSLGYTPSSGITGSYGNFVIKFLRNCQTTMFFNHANNLYIFVTVFQKHYYNDCIILLRQWLFYYNYWLLQPIRVFCLYHRKLALRFETPSITKHLIQQCSKNCSLNKDMLWSECLCPPFICWKSNVQGNGIRRWEVIRSWGL